MTCKQAGDHALPPPHKARAALAEIGQEMQTDALPSSANVMGDVYKENPEC